MSDHMIGGILIVLNLFLLGGLMIFVTRRADLKAASQKELNENSDDN